MAEWSDDHFVKEIMTAKGLTAEQRAEEIRKKQKEIIEKNKPKSALFGILGGPQ
jgi:hypothetical protein